MGKNVLFINEGRYVYVSGLIDLIEKKFREAGVNLRSLEIDLVDRNRDFSVDMRSAFGGVYENNKHYHEVFFEFHGNGYDEDFQPYYVFNPSKAVLRICYRKNSVQPSQTLEDFKIGISEARTRIYLLPKKYSFGIPSNIGSGYDEEGRIDNEKKLIVQSQPEDYTAGVCIDVHYGDYNIDKGMYTEEASFRNILDFLVDYSTK